MRLAFDISLPNARVLKTSNLSCYYEQGMLRGIKCGDTEVVRMIYAAVRDKDWGTVPCFVFNEKVVQEASGFKISYSANYSFNGIEYEADFLITGTTNDSICLEMKGNALNDFFSNRIGLCVHLPVDGNRGKDCAVVTVDGDEVEAVFPNTIVPHQPFTNISAVHWQYADAARVSLSFEGDVFEAEDQRNWLDHSYKIYSRPLSLPFPFQVKAGESLQQSVSVSVVAQTDKLPVSSSEDKSTAVTIPALGIAAADEAVLLTAEEVRLLQTLPFTRYRVEIDFKDGWRRSFYIHLKNAKAFSARLELVLFFSDDFQNEIAFLLEELNGHVDWVTSLLPLHVNNKVTPPFLQQYFYPLVKARFPEIAIGYGTDIYFTELNRQRPESNLFDFLSFSVNPQVHSLDAITILENIDTIPEMLETIRSYSNKPVVVSPITFKKRKNNDGADEFRHQLVDGFDERQYKDYGAGWFLLCVAALDNVQQATFFKTTGDSGILEYPGDNSLQSVLQTMKYFGAQTIQKVTTDLEPQIVFKNNAGKRLVYQLDKNFIPANIFC